MSISNTPTRKLALLGSASENPRQVPLVFKSSEGAGSCAIVELYQVHRCTLRTMASRHDCIAGSIRPGGLVYGTTCRSSPATNHVYPNMRSDLQQSVQACILQHSAAPTLVSKHAALFKRGI